MNSRLLLYDNGEMLAHRTSILRSFASSSSSTTTTLSEPMVLQVFAKSMNTVSPSRRPKGPRSLSLGCESVRPAYPLFASHTDRGICQEILYVCSRPRVIESSYEACIQPGAAFYFNGENGKQLRRMMVANVTAAERYWWLYKAYLKSGPMEHRRVSECRPGVVYSEKH
jgi:hypothetical protein